MFDHDLQVNLNMNLELQGPFHVFLHKLTDTLAHAESGDQNVRALMYITKEVLINF